MNVRKFTAPTVSEALAEVKKELGEDAVILRTRTIPDKGKLPLGGKDLVEVMAATPDRSLPDTESNPNQVSQILQRLDRRPDPRAVNELKNEISELKGHVGRLAEQVRHDKSAHFSPETTKRHEELIHLGVDSHVAFDIADELQQKSQESHSQKRFSFELTLTSLIAKRIKVHHPLLKVDGTARVVALVGPTGVGKTTTLAKLVTSYRHWGTCNTAIVSADTYRVAALEQIKTFAAIAGLPMEAVYTPAAMPTAIARHRHRDAIFVDTPGRSQSDGQKLDELLEFLDAARADERLLCLSVNTRLEDQLDVIERYGKLKPTGIIFTKVDDSRYPGGILSVSSNTDIPFSYITCGQNVPDDVVYADGGHIAELFASSDALGRLQKERFSSWIKADERRVAGVSDG